MKRGGSTNNKSSNIILLKVNPAVNTPKPSSNILPNFQETIIEEADRKDYYDNLRNVLRRFGQTTIERKKLISKFEYK